MKDFMKRLTKYQETCESENSFKERKKQNKLFVNCVNQVAYIFVTFVSH